MIGSRILGEVAGIRRHWTTVAFEKAGEKPGDFTTEWSNELTHKALLSIFKKPCVV